MAEQKTERVDSGELFHRCKENLLNNKGGKPQLKWSEIYTVLDKHLFFRSSDRNQNKTTFQQSFTKYWKEQQLGK